MVETTLYHFQLFTKRCIHWGANVKFIISRIFQSVKRFFNYFMKEKKLLQVVNLSPSESWIEKLTEVHPMKQVAYASVIQVCVFLGMLGAFKLIGMFV